MRFVLVALLLHSASVAAAGYTNLLINGDFAKTSQLSGWTSCSSASWSSDDAAGLAASGSLELSASSIYDPHTMTFILGTASCASGCLPVRPGAAYLLGGQSRLAYGTVMPGFNCVAYPTPDCTGAGDTLSSPAMSTASSWDAVASDASGTLSNAIRSVRCWPSATGVAEAGAGIAHIDNLFFGTDALFADGFEG